MPFFDFRTRIWRQCTKIVQENVSEGSFVFGKTKSSDFVLPGSRDIERYEDEDV